MLRPILEEAGLVDVKTFGVQDYLTAHDPPGRLSSWASSAVSRQ
jgi:hypothetical protein